MQEKGIIYFPLSRGFEGLTGHWHVEIDYDSSINIY